MSFFFSAGIRGDAIPDSENLQARYDWIEASGTTTVVDQTDNGFDIDGSYTGPSASINGNQAGEFDGDGDSLSNTDFSIQPPYEVYSVIQAQSTGSIVEVLLYFGDGEGGSFALNNGDWVIRSDGSDSSESYPADTNPHVFNISLDSGGTSDLYIDDNNEINSSKSFDLTDFVVGSDLDGTSDAELYSGEILVYDVDHSSGIRTDVNDYLASRWGITL